MEFFRCVLGKVSCSFIRNSDKNSGICLEIFRNDSKAIWFLWKHNWSIAPSLKIREIRWLQIFSRGVQNFELLIGKQLPLTIIYRTLLYKMTWHVNPLSILQRLSDVCLQKNGEKMLTGHFLTNPSKTHMYSIFFVVAVQYSCAGSIKNQQSSGIKFSVPVI